MQRVLQRQGTFHLNDHFQKAGIACSHIDDLVANLTKLHDDCATWRARYLQMKRLHFAQFLGNCDTQLLSQCFRGWKDIWAENTAGRDLLRLTEEESRLLKEWEVKLRNQDWEYVREIEALDQSQKKALDELDAQLKMREEQLSALCQERDKVRGCSTRSIRVLQSVTAQLAAVDDAGSVSTLDMELPPPTNRFEQMCRSVHTLLSRVDECYISPLKPQLLRNAVAQLQEEAENSDNVSLEN